MVPHVLGAPRRGRLDPFPGRTPEDAVFSVHRPASRVECLLRFVAADLTYGIQPLGVRLEALRDVGRIDKPVVHLHVDVRVVVAAPGGSVAAVPEPLEVGRQRARAGRADHQIARVLEKKLLEIGIRTALLVSGQTLVRGQLRCRPGCLSHIQRESVEQFLIVPDVLLQQPAWGPMGLVEWFLRSG